MDDMTNGNCCWGSDDGEGVGNLYCAMEWAEMVLDVLRGDPCGVWLDHPELQQRPSNWGNIKLS